VPRASMHTLLADGDAIVFHSDGIEADGTRRTSEARGVPDGVRRSSGPTSGDAMRVAVLDGALVTEVFGDDQVVRRTSRVVKDDVMTVTESCGEHQTEAAYTRARVKQVIVYRRDLAMRKGKIAAQAAHASMAVFFERNEGPIGELVVPLHGPIAAWVHGPFAKVVLSVETEADLLRVHEEARARGVPTALITDSGRTEFGGVPTRTTVAVGPWVAGAIDEITGPEGLVKTKLA